MYNMSISMSSTKSSSLTNIHTHRQTHRHPYSINIYRLGLRPSNGYMMKEYLWKLKVFRPVRLFKRLNCSVITPYARITVKTILPVGQLIRTQTCLWSSKIYFSSFLFILINYSWLNQACMHYSIVPTPSPFIPIQLLGTITFYFIEKRHLSITLINYA